ncbi:hypothetical protein K431DRAFT_94263 [Polychaeton citri CBS 116435]|uniref:Uncharacterized protein n=1 Tax=Polychaeton citri CBS 116435 TaxID=1314669 RepID=A0A9P4Q463_9PEZI|nr:hypothetical protein K431DRAFT_94263 [Polychaeton citri CBS 116435]
MREYVRLASGPRVAIRRQRDQSQRWDGVSWSPSSHREHTGQGNSSAALGIGTKAKGQQKRRHTSIQPHRHTRADPRQPVSSWRGPRIATTVQRKPRVCALRYLAYADATLTRTVTATRQDTRGFLTVAAQHTEEPVILSLLIPNRRQNQGTSSPDVGGQARRRPLAHYDERRGLCDTHSVAYNSTTRCRTLPSLGGCLQGLL